MTSTIREYKKHYKAFSQNVAYAARTWHHHVHLSNRAKEDRVILEALNKAGQYWLDQRYAAVQTTIIFLGKIFDNNDRTYNVNKMLRVIHEEKEHFSKSELRKRKLELRGEFQGIDEYVQNATEPDSEDFKAISAEVKKAKLIWKRIKELRDRIYAHNEILSDAERKALYNAVNNSDVTEIIQLLLNISEALWQLENNGIKPNFSSDFTSPVDRAKDNIEKLIASMLHV